MKRVLITGVTGYIGSRLARWLMQECEVYGLVREPLNLTNIRDIQSQIKLLYVDECYESIATALNVSRPDMIYHLAACCSSSHGPEQTPTLIHSNITFGAYLLEAASALGELPLVYAATIASHYKNAPYCPQNLYGATKQAFSDLLAYYTDAGLLRAVALVLSDTYGPGDHRPKVLNLVKQASQTGERLLFSDGEQDYDVVHIDDVVCAFVEAGKLLLRNHWKNKTFQVFSQEPLSLRETVEKMLQVNDLALNAEWGAHPNPERQIRQAIRVYPLLPGWKPKIKLDDGLRCFGNNFK